MVQKNCTLIQQTNALSHSAILPYIKFIRASLRGHIITNFFYVPPKVAPNKYCLTVFISITYTYYLTLPFFRMVKKSLYFLYPTYFSVRSNFFLFLGVPRRCPTKQVLCTYFVGHVRPAFPPSEEVGAFHLLCRVSLPVPPKEARKEETCFPSFGGSRCFRRRHLLHRGKSNGGSRHPTKQVLCTQGGTYFVGCFARV